jgi:hypothetical protein
MIRISYRQLAPFCQGTLASRFRRPLDKLQRSLAIPTFRREEPHRLSADIDAALGQQIFDLPQLNPKELQPPLRAEGRKINTLRRVPTTCGISSTELLRDIFVAVWNPQWSVSCSWLLYGD